MGTTNRRELLKTLGLGAAVAATPRVLWGRDEQKGEAVKPPNIVFVLADDMGYGDLKCYNAESKIPTPNLDALAGEGMRFTDAHAPGSWCSPTRYGLMTGRYPFRMKRIRGKPWIENGRMTVASMLKAAGYHTACVGKWHLGFEGEKNPKADTPMRGGPVDNGFDEYFGIPASLDIPPYYYIEGDRCVARPSEKIGDSNSAGWTNIQGAFWRGGGLAPGYKHADVLKAFLDRSVGIVATHAATHADKPLFLYLALSAPHTPWLPDKQAEGKSRAGMYGDFVHQVDREVGRLLAKLEDAGMAENTLVLFSSDNGPVWYPADVKRLGHAAVGPLRGMKGDAWEGGHRMPLIARWPGKVKAGAVSDELVSLTDMMATFAAIVGATVSKNAGEDSCNILPILTGKHSGKPVRETMVNLTAGGRGRLAIRKGSWKLIPFLGSGGFSKPRSVKPGPDDPAGQLYNLDDDIGEQKNLYAEKPKIAKELRDLLAKTIAAGRS